MRPFQIAIFKTLQYWRISPFHICVMGRRLPYWRYRDNSGFAKYGPFRVNVFETLRDLRNKSSSFCRVFETLPDWQKGTLPDWRLRELPDWRNRDLSGSDRHFQEFTGLANRSHRHLRDRNTTVLTFLQQFQLGEIGTLLRLFFLSGLVFSRFFRINKLRTLSNWKSRDPSGMAKWRFRDASGLA